MAVIWTFSLIVASLLSIQMTGQTVSAAYLVISASPLSIQPILTTTLKLRCSIKLDNTLNARQIHGNLGVEQTNTEPPALADVDHIVSIILKKYNSVTMTNEAVANIIPYDKPVAEGSYANLVQVDGNTDSSPVPGEKGYLEVTWFKPMEGGTFSCEVTALTSDRHPTTLTQNLEVSVIEPGISDLVIHIAAHDLELSKHKKYITQLEEVNKELKQEVDILKSNITLHQDLYAHLRQDLDTLTANITHQTSALISQVNGLKRQNLQTGFDVCRSQFIRFPTPYVTKPQVVTSFIRLGFTLTANSLEEPYIFQVNAENVDAVGFNVTCINTGHGAIADFVWLAIEA
ncbi:DSC-2 [Biomphalaria glabrata]|nr:DSC-2 [Biomphalaria glabrata]